MFRLIYKKLIKVLHSKLFPSWVFELQCSVNISTRLIFTLEETSEKLTLTQENLALLHENDNVEDQPAHVRRLMSIFFNHYMESIIVKHASCKIGLSLTWAELR